MAIPRLNGDPKGHSGDKFRLYVSPADYSLKGNYEFEFEILDSVNSHSY